MWKIILADGTELSGLERNGNNYISRERIAPSVFAKKLDRMTITNGEETIVLRNAVLIQQVHCPDADPAGWYLCFRELTEAEMQQPVLDAAIYLARLALAGETADTDDKRLRASGLYPDWAPGKHPKGEIYNANEQTWECFSPYDNTVHPDVTPKNPETWHTFNRPLHGTSSETARPWVKPQHGTTDIYHPGEHMVWTDGSVYRCLKDTNFSPEDYPAGWEIVEEKEE